jgi:hypothetical protein
VEADGAIATAADVARAYQIDAAHLVAAIHHDWQLA